MRTLSIFFVLALFYFLLHGCTPPPKQLAQTDLKTAVMQSDSVETETKQVFRCGATTKKGLPCRNRVKAAGLKCHLHQ